MTALERELAEALRDVLRDAGTAYNYHPGYEALAAYDAAAQQTDKQRARVAELNAAQARTVANAGLCKQCGAAPGAECSDGAGNRMGSATHGYGDRF